MRMSTVDHVEWHEGKVRTNLRLSFMRNKIKSKEVGILARILAFLINVNTYTVYLYCRMKYCQSGSLSFFSSFNGGPLYSQHAFVTSKSVFVKCNEDSSPLTKDQNPISQRYRQARRWTCRRDDEGHSIQSLTPIICVIGKERIERNLIFFLYIFEHPPINLE